MIDKEKLGAWNPGAVVIVAIDEKTGRFALVIDRQKPEPHYWKFPGGKIELKDKHPVKSFDDHLAADHAAPRELEEETGLACEREGGRFKLFTPFRLGTTEKRTHTVYEYVYLADFSTLAALGDEGETVRAFSLEQIRVLQQKGAFFLPHEALLEKALRFIKGESAPAEKTTMPFPA